MDDLLEMADTSDREEIKARLEAVLREIGEVLEETEIEPERFRVLTWREDGAILQQVGEFVPLGRNLRMLYKEEGIEALEEFQEYLEEKHNLTTHKSFGSNLLVDAFGEHGEHTGQLDERIDDIVARIEADIAGRPRVRSRILLRGIEIGCDIQLDDGVWLRVPNEKTVLEKRPEGPGMGLEIGGHMHAQCALDLTLVEDGNKQNERLIAKRSLVLNTLRLYSCANVSAIANFNEPLSYRLVGNYSYSRSSRDSLPRFSFDPLDVDRYNRLEDLLSYFHNESGKFSSPVDVPLNHFDESLQRRTSPQSSISFSIIGLESLYRAHTENTASAKDVRRYCALVLGEVTKSLSPVDVLANLEKAYDFRNSWAHGDKHSHDEEKFIQSKLWDYLRVSIATFAWLTKSGKLENGALQIEDALIEEGSREDLQKKLEEFSSINYLPVR